MFVAEWLIEMMKKSMKITDSEKKTGTKARAT